MSRWIDSARNGSVVDGTGMLHNTMSQLPSSQAVHRALLCKAHLPAAPALGGTRYQSPLVAGWPAAFTVGSLHQSHPNLQSSCQDPKAGLRTSAVLTCSAQS